MTKTPSVTLIITDSHHTSYLTSLVACLRPLGCHISVLLMTDLDDPVDRFRPPGVEHFFTTLQERPDFSAIRPHLKRADLIVFDEPFTFRIMATFLILSLRLSAPMVLSIHNLHTWFFPRLVARPKALAKTLLRKALTMRFRHFLVIGSNILDYAHKRLPGRDFLYVPFGIPEADCPPPADAASAGERLKVVIPGSVNRRRDYDWLVDSLERGQRLKDCVEITLLGRPLDEYGHKILERCQRLRELGWALETFPDFVPRKEYHRRLCEADVLLSVFDIRYRTADGQEEIYGQSKETGVSYLALSYAKPLIAPAEFVPLHEIEGQVLPYDQPEAILDLLADIASGRFDLSPYRSRAWANRESFDLGPSSAALANQLPRSAPPTKG